MSKRKAIGVGVLLLIVAVVVVALSSPGFQRTIEEILKPRKPVVPPADPMEVFRQPWDSNGDVGWPVAESLAVLSDTAYLTPVDAEEKYRSLGFDQIKTFVDASMVGYVVSKGDVTVVVFRGTDDNWDWFINLYAVSVNTKHGTIHKGFYDAYGPLRPQIDKLISQSRPKYLWITGHSLGGALAVICTYEMIESPDTAFKGLVTFGQPMVAHKQLADYLDDALAGRFVHFVNEHDIVPRVPPNYSHCGSLVWFKDGKVRRNERKQVPVGAFGAGPPAKEEPDSELTPLSEAEFRKAKSDVSPQKQKVDPQGRPIYEGNSPWIQDHMMTFYLERLRNLHAPPAP